MSSVSSANAKRMQLSHDQRAVLEAVYAIEKLPDAALRERLSSYLALSARQIQVWFQNRRQRAKAKTPTRSALSSSVQIMDALFEFSDDMPMEARARRALQAIFNGPSATGCTGTVDDDVDVAGSSVRGGAARDPAASQSAPLLPESDNLFEWGLTAPTIPPLNGLAAPSHLQLSSQPVMSTTETPAALCAPRVDDRSALQLSGPLAEPAAPTVGAVDAAPLSTFQPAGTAVTASLPAPLPCPMLLEAFMGFACHSLGLDAVDYWQARPGPHSNLQPALMQSYAPEGARALNDLATCRSMLAGPLSEVAACTREHAWFGACKEQHELLGRLGVCARSIVGVPCHEHATCSASPPPPVTGVLVLYSCNLLNQSPTLHCFLRLLSTAVGSLTASRASNATEALPWRLAHSREERVSYTLHPAQAPVSTFSWLLLVAARILQADVAEHWTIRQGGGSNSTTAEAERLLASTSLDAQSLVLATGARSEAAHPFSAQMCRASVFAGKLVWCNATHPSGVLEGVQLPLQTAIGVPMRSAATNCVTVFVLYATRQLEQSAATSTLLAQLALLARASEALALPSAPPPAPLAAPPAAPQCAGSGAIAAQLHDDSSAVGFAPVGCALFGRRGLAGGLSAAQPADVAGQAAVRPAEPVEGELLSMNGEALRCVKQEPLKAEFMPRMPFTCAPMPSSSTSATPLPASMPKVASCHSLEMATHDSGNWEQLSTEQVLSLIDNCMYDDSALQAHGLWAPLASHAALKPLADPRASSDTSSRANPMPGLQLQRSGVSGGLESLEL